MLVLVHTGAVVCHCDTNRTENQMSSACTLSNAHVTLSNCMLDTSKSRRGSTAFYAWPIAQKTGMSLALRITVNKIVWCHHRIPFFSCHPKMKCSMSSFWRYFSLFSLWPKCNRNEMCFIGTEGGGGGRDCCDCATQIANKKELYFRCTTSRKHSVDREY